MFKICFLVAIWSIVVIDVESTWWVTPSPPRDDSKVLLVSTVFRHGDRTPIGSIDGIFPVGQGPNTTFYPDGQGQLTNNGKRRAYQYGQVLRKRYNNFLGGIYTQEAVKGRSTSIIRAKMTLLLVLAGLYPPESMQRWNRYLNWQPINTISVPVRSDGLLLGITCPLHSEALNKVVATDEVQEQFAHFNDLAEKLTSITGQKITSVWDMFTLFHRFSALMAMGHTLPQWTKEIYPDGMLRDAAIFQYQLFSYNTELTRLNGGIFLNRVIEEMRTVMNGTSNGRKINLYSGHELSVAAVLQVLGVYNDDIPQYSSGVIIELRTKNGEYFVKVLYHLGIPEKTIELRIPGCDVLCPFDQFVELRKDVIASGDDLQCEAREPIEN